jgi:hypothetical protein
MPQKSLPIGWRSYAVACPVCKAPAGRLCHNRKPPATRKHWISSTHCARRDVAAIRYRRGRELPEDARRLIEAALALIASKRRSVEARLGKKPRRKRRRLWRPSVPSSDA